MDTFDYVIVGGGSAGSVLAARLSQSNNATVCLLEAGPSDSNPLIHIPAGFVNVIFDPNLTWSFATDANPATGIRSVPMIQGKVLGGGGSINGMVYVRGQAADFNHWAQLGNRGWSYDDVLPCFRRMERRPGPSDSRYRGTDGPLPVTNLVWHNDLTEAFIESVVSLGVRRNSDYNGENQEGVGRYQYNIEGRRRISSARAYLRRELRSHRVDLRTAAQAKGLVFDGGKVVGVTYMRGDAGQIEEVRANREVILCAGAINTPKLLQLSGLGPSKLLRDLGIDIIRDIPGVGEGLQDHYAARMTFRTRGATTINDLVSGLALAGQVGRWLLGRPSVLGIGVIQGAAFVKSRPGLDLPDFVVSFTAGSLKEGIQGKLDGTPGMTLGFYQLRPESRGYVRARSRDPSVPPSIQPNYLSSAVDCETLLAAMKFARRIVAAEPLSRYGGDEMLPGTGLQSEEDLLSYGKRTGTSGYHVCGSCRMGPTADPWAVVDSSLRVRGVAGLRIADASIMPSITSGNTNAPTMMIAEKAADLILGT